MLTVASLLWDANEHSLPFSRRYDERWVARLYDGFARNLTRPWRFVLFTDCVRDLPAQIQQEPLKSKVPDYGACIEPYRFGVPMILVGLDTVVTGPIDHLADYCVNADVIALPRAIYRKDTCCNGVALIPAGQQHIWRNWRGENDMDWMRQQRFVYIDDLFPGQVVSYKGVVKHAGLNDARIVFFHGEEKPDQLLDRSWIKRHWLGDIEVAA